MQADGDYQAQVAHSLVESCGVETAIHYCQNNHWDGVLQAILRRHAGKARGNELSAFDLRATA